MFARCSILKPIESVVILKRVVVETYLLLKLTWKVLNIMLILCMAFFRKLTHSENTPNTPPTTVKNLILFKKYRKCVFLWVRGFTKFTCIYFGLCVFSESFEFNDEVRITQTSGPPLSNLPFVGLTPVTALLSYTCTDDREVITFEFEICDGCDLCTMCDVALECLGGMFVFKKVFLDVFLKPQHQIFVIFCGWECVWGKLSAPVDCYLVFIVLFFFPPKDVQNLCFWRNEKIVDFTYRLYRSKNTPFTPLHFHILQTHLNHTHTTHTHTHTHQLFSWTEIILLINEIWEIHTRFSLVFAIFDY